MSVHFCIEGLSVEQMLSDVDYKAVEEVPKNLPGGSNVITNITLAITSEVLHKADDLEGGN